MREWLSKEFNPPQGIAERIAKRALKKAKRRKKIERSVIFIMPFFFIALFAFLMGSGGTRFFKGDSHEAKIRMTGDGHPERSFGASSPEGSPNFAATRFFKGDSHEAKIRMTGDGHPDFSFGASSPEESPNFVAQSHGLGKDEILQERSPQRENQNDRGGNNPRRGNQNDGDGANNQNYIRMVKVDNSLEISWDGEGDFIVYKCDSPKFDKCSVADIVSGNRYIDKDDNSAKIVFYRIEPLKKG